MAVKPSDPNISIRRPEGAPDPMAGLAADALAGLAEPPRWLPPKHFYDAAGSALFERITRLPEYYQTRTERGILERIASGLVERTRPRALVEFGSGSASKTRILLDEMSRRELLAGYGAVEVSEAALLRSAAALAERYPGLEFEGILADFRQPVELPFGDLPRLVLFLGSTIGNLSEEEAIDFLRGVRERMEPRDGFLIGFDLVKDPARLEAAYDDASGVTARFNLNVLSVLNRELDGDFRPEDFRHRALYDEERERIEMHLVARRPLVVRLRAIDLRIHMEEGETICTEYSQKYTDETARTLVEEAGLELARWHTDGERLFAVGLARLPG